MVSQNQPAEDLPALYRAVLDGVAELERRGQRQMAGSIRRDAITAYSAAWDDRHRTHLSGLVNRVRRELDRRAPRGRHETAEPRSAKDDRRRLVDTAGR
jgi:hypothetical protein